MTPSFTSIPILDLSLASSPSTRSTLLVQLHHAITKIGFLYIKNHGVPPSTIDNLTRILPSLFALPAAEKERCALHNSPHFLGYSGFGSERTAEKVDHREQFEFATEVEDSVRGDGDEPWRGLYGPNQWPTGHPSIKRIVETYLAEVTELSSRFIDLVGDALNLQTHRLHSYLSPQHRLKLVHYATSTDTERDAQGVGPHKDSSGWWTFLLQASPPPIGGLQVLNRAGQWIDVPSIPGTFVVNIGQAFEVVSGGLCPATIHRVLSGTETRYSVPFFQGVRGDLTKQQFTDLWQDLRGEGLSKADIAEGINSAFLRGDIDTWGEWQLRTKIRSHPDTGKQFYGNVFDKYSNPVQDFS